MQGFTFSEMLDWYDWERDHWYKRAEEHFERIRREQDRSRTKKGLR